MAHLSHALDDAASVIDLLATIPNLSPKARAILTTRALTLASLTYGLRSDLAALLAADEGQAA